MEPRFKVRVKMKGFRKYRGFSDLVPTYCCSGESCYFVVFPSIRYEGYFRRNDVEVLGEAKRKDFEKLRSYSNLLFE